MVTYNIEVEHKDLERVRLLVNGEEVFNDENVDRVCKFTLDVENDLDVEVWHWPWGIKPILRIDNFLLEKSIMEAVEMDHLFSFKLDQDFFKTYFENIINTRYDAIFPDGKIVPAQADAIIGLCVDCSDLANRLRAKIDAK